MSRISWVLGTSITSAKIFDKDGEPEPVSSAIWDTKLRRYQSGDRIVVLYQNREPLETAPIRSNTMRAALSAIEHGLLQTVPEHAEGIAERISHFLRVTDRKRLSKKWKAGSLKYKDLIGDYRFFEGNLQRKRGIWHYALGS